MHTLNCKYIHIQKVSYTVPNWEVVTSSQIDIVTSQQHFFWMLIKHFSLKKVWLLSTAWTSWFSGPQSQAYFLPYAFDLYASHPQTKYKAFSWHVSWCYWLECYPLWMTLAFTTWHWSHIKQLEDWVVITFYDLALVVTSNNSSYILFVEVVIKSHSDCRAEGVFCKTLFSWKYCCSHFW